MTTLFKRATTGTYIDASGHMQTAAINVMRSNYTPGGPTRLLIESAATNIITQSQFLSGWTATNVTATANALAAPDQTTTAMHLVETSTNAYHYYDHSEAATDNRQPYTFSIFATNGNREGIAIVMIDNGNTANTLTCVADLVTGQTTWANANNNATGVSVGIVSLGTGWYRISATGTLSPKIATTGITCRVYLNTVMQYAGSNLGLYVWGAQLETGTVATSYIPTSGAAVTRAADFGPYAELPVSFYCIEQQICQYGIAVAFPMTFALGGRGGHSHGTLNMTPDQTPLEPDSQITVSDRGYRTLSTDTNIACLAVGNATGLSGIVPYPGVVNDAFALDRHVNLDPTSSSIAATWGSISLSNADGRFNNMPSQWVNDGRPATILAGKKLIDTTRGYEIDPAYASLTTFFSGVSTPWSLSDTTLDIPLRDASYFIETPAQNDVYCGTGGYDGTADLAGKPKPMSRGGTPSYPIQNVTPTLIDPVNLVYQYNNAPGSVVNAYEGGYQTWILDGDVADLYSGSPAAGHMRTCNAKGCFQLGSNPKAAVTVDVTGAFPNGAVVTTAAQLALGLLEQDLGVNSAHINEASFNNPTAPDPAAGVAGIFISPDDTIDGPTALDRIVSSFGGKIIPTRTGLLSLYLLRAITGSPMATWSNSMLVSLVPSSLPTTVSPPPYRTRVAYNHNYTVQTSGVSPSADPTRQQFIAAADRYAAYSSNAVLRGYRRPNDFAPVGGALLSQTDAQNVANNLGALWCAPRTLYAATMPASVGIAYDLGNIVAINYKQIGNLAVTGQIVGEFFRSSDATITFLVLV